jgi:hypothetical protein
VAATNFAFLERELVIATQGLSQAQMNARLAQYAKQELAKALAEGASQTYDRYVNGRIGAVEESVQAPGPIVYVFTNWPLIINTALEELRKRAPRRSGRYAASFIVLADQKLVTDYRNIPAGAEVIITNTQPYVRRIEVGANRSKGKRMFDQTKNVLNRRFKEAFRSETRFLDIQSGVAPGVPYVLKYSAGRRRDRQAGMPISYPAVVINAV